MQLLIQFAASLGLTLLFEEWLALLWGIRGRDLLLVALVNVLTNPAVVCIHILVPGFVPGTLLPELAAVTAEALLYVRKQNRISRPILFAVLANVFSYGLGELINRLV